EELVVKTGEIPTQQWQPPESSYGLGRHALAATLHTPQHHATRNVLLAARHERCLALAEPALEVEQPAHIGKTRRFMLETQHALHVQQVKFFAIELRQIFLSDRPVIADQALRQIAGLGMTQTTQILHH